MKETGPDVTRQIRRQFIRQIPAPSKVILLILRIYLVFLPASCMAQAQPSEAGVFVPSLFDPHNRTVAPGASAKKPIRFLTADDYPPFEFLGPDGALAGYNVDVAKAICDELQNTACTIQPRRWDNLLDALEAKEGDVLAASLKDTAAIRQRAHFTSAYYLTPARFIALSGGRSNYNATPEGLGARTIGVVAGSAHEAFLNRFFNRSTVKPYPDQAQMTADLRGGKVDLAFGDAITLAIWMNDPQSGACCAFQGGPYLEPDYFGEGVGMAVRPEDDELRQTLNWALQRLEERGVMTELYLKYFPIGIY